MKNIDKEPTYYVSLTEYNEVKRMFLKANDEINALKELLKECKQLFLAYSRGEKCLEIKGDFYNIWEYGIRKIDEVLK